MRVLALVPYPEGRAPGQRYRIEQWAPRLRRLGVEIQFAPFLEGNDASRIYERGALSWKMMAMLSGYRKRLLTLGDVGRFEAAFVYREAVFLDPGFFERLLARRIPIVFDFDDAIYLGAASEANRWLRLVKWRGKTRTICRLARQVTVGNEILAEYVRREAPQTPVAVVPSTIDTDVYRLASRPQNERLVVGWTGSLTTLPYLVDLLPALQQLRREVDFELRVIGGQIDCPGIQTSCLPWRAETEVEDLLPMDIGLMPLPDDEWSRGKCGMKALQYMGCGIPAVVSPVGVNTTIVRDGVNGFHARTREEWVEKIRVLAASPTLRRRLGGAGRETVERQYSAQVQAPRFAEILRSVVASGAGWTRPHVPSDVSAAPR